MNVVYLVTTSFNADYDCADGFVVIARNEHAAKMLTMGKWGDHNHVIGLFDSLTAEAIGASNTHAMQVVLRSFNAG